MSVSWQDGGAFLLAGLALKAMRETWLAAKASLLGPAHTEEMSVLTKHTPITPRNINRP